MVVNVPFEEDLRVSISSISFLQNMQVVPNLPRSILTLLEAAHAHEHLAFAVISTQEHQREHQREAHQPQLEATIELCILEYLGK